ncbi:MAG: hypothetical protein ACREMR_03070 [Gemmatimonadales bacterium]
MVALVVLLWQAPLVLRAATIRSDRLQETSGVVVSRAHRGVLWSHNDSGDGPYLYATDLSGTDRGRLRVAGAAAVDWEDMASGPCPTGPGSCLYIGDTGDNARERRWVAVYAVPEPAPPAATRDTPATAARRLRLRYPGGPRDVEALYVVPADGTLFLVSKVRSGSARVYRVDRARWGADTVVTAVLVQELRIPRSQPVTGAAMRADGRLVALRVPDEVLLFTPGADGMLAPRGGPACRLPGLQAQGEALAFVDDSTLVLTSERAHGRRAAIHTVRCPSGPAPTPPPDAVGRKP